MKILIIILFLITNYLFSETLEKVSLQLHWKYQFQFAGFIAAKEKGYYKDEGLDVELKESNPNIKIVDEVINKKSNYGIGSSSITLSYLRGKPIKLISSFFKRSAMILLTNPEIKYPEDLINKKIMTNSKERFISRFKYMFKSQNVDVDKLIFIKHSYNIKDFISGKVDATTAFISDQPYKLDKLGVNYNILDPSDYGIYNLLLELFTSEHEAINHPERTEAFRRASVKGWKYALSHKKEIIEIIHEKYAKDIPIDELENEANEIEKLILPFAYKIGSIDKNYIKKQMEIFKDEYKLNNKTSKNFIFTNKLSKKLTKKEKLYLKKKKIIKVCTNPNWAPIEFTENDIPQGISIDTLNIIKKMINVKLQIIKTKSWSESQLFLKQRKCDILPAAIKTVQRSKYANFTEAYLTYSLAIITQSGKPVVTNLEAILDKKMSRKKGSGLISKLKQKYPQIKIKESEGYVDGFKMVSEGDVYYTIATLPVFSYYKNKYQIDNLQIAGFLKSEYSLSIAVRNDDITLLNILNKKLKEISNKTHYMLYDKWANNVKQESDNSILIKIIILIIIIILILVFNQVRLRLKNTFLQDRVKERTKEIEAKVKEVVKINKKLENYSYTISHDLKEPIRSIRTFSEFIMEDYENTFDEEAKDYFSRIIKASNKMALMIDDLLILSKIGKTDIKFNKVNISEVIKEVESILQQKVDSSNTTIKVNNLPEIYCQYTWMQTVFLNLITNSIKYSDKKETIIEISYKKLDKFHEFSVKDNGKGIPREQHSKVFELFRRAHQDRDIEGSGAGLAIVSSVAEQHDGQAWIDWSELGKGTIIKFTISDNCNI